MLLLLLFVFSFPFSSSSIISCYYRFNQPSPSDVPGDICTHIILIGHTVLDHLGHFQQPPKEVARQFFEIKKKFPNIKLLLCQTGSNPDFSTLILRESYGNDLLLTAAVAGPPTITKIAYDMDAFNQYLDLVQVMNYDFHVFSWTNPFVGFNAPLRKINRGEVGPIGKMNSAAAMATYQDMGLWRNKTLFGIPTYNLAFFLVNSYFYKPYSLAEKPLYGYDTRSSICDLLRHKGKYEYVWNEKAASPYIHGTDKVWISIEDERSVTSKSSYAMELGVPGVMELMMSVAPVGMALILY